MNEFSPDPDPPFQPPGAAPANPKLPPHDSEAVWSYRGYKMRGSEFTTAMVHFFRAEVQRANVWRTRLDATTNWAVVTTGAAITIAFNPSGYHAVILLNTLLITLFLFIEARRYRYYELWSYRIRLIETDFYAAMLVPPFHPAPDWAESLAEHLLHPSFPISMWEAFGRRFRRNFMWIYVILAAAWLVKTWLIPPGAANLQEFFRNAAIGNMSGIVVLAVGMVFNIGLFIIGLVTAGMHQATGEVLPRYAQDTQTLGASTDKHPEGLRAWFRQSRRRQQYLAFIITDQAQALGEVIMNELRRGVTAIPGKGMYTGQEHEVLMCALTVTEVNHLKTVVRNTDPKAFVIVSPAQEVLGRGFVPLKVDD